MHHISSGGTPSRDRSEYFGGNIPWAKISDIENSKEGILIDTEEKITEDGLSNIRNKIFKKGTLLFAMYGSIGKVAIAGVDTAANQAILGIYPKNDKELFLKYLIFWFKENKSKMVNQGRGGILQNLSATIVRNQKIELPVYEIQIKIAKILTQAEKLIAQRKESIALLDEYLKSTFLEMFGDPSSVRHDFRKGKIRDVVSEVKYGTSRPSIENGTYPYLRMNNITTNGYMDYSNLKYIDIADDEKEKYVVRKGDLLFNRTNSKELVGKTGVYCEDSEMIIAGYLLRVRTNKKANSWFLWGYLNSSHGKQTLSSMCKSIVGMANINAQEFQEINISIPPIELQNQFAQIVEKTEALKNRYEHSLRELEQLFGSLSQRAFKGELDLSGMGVSEDSYKISDTPPSPTPPQPEKTKKERPQVAVKTDTEASIWLSNRDKGKTGKVPFNTAEGNAVLRTEFAQKDAGFHFQAFEAFLKKEGFEYAFEQVKDFLFEKLEQKELLQYYSNVEWMEERYRQEIGSDEDDFSSDGRIWLVVNNKVVP